VLILAAKMKCTPPPGDPGVKNLIGLAASAIPVVEGGQQPFTFHGDVKFDRRLPRVVI